MVEKNGRIYLDTLFIAETKMISAVLIVVWFGAGVLLALNPYGNASAEGLRLYILFVALSLFFIILMISGNKTYKISYDDNAIYMHKGGVGYIPLTSSEIMIKYSEIDQMYGNPGNMNLAPFEYISIYRREDKYKEKFFLSLHALRHEEIRSLLNFMENKCPDKFPPEIIDFMNS